MTQPLSPRGAPSLRRRPGRPLVAPVAPVAPAAPAPIVAIVTAIALIATATAGPTAAWAQPGQAAAAADANQTAALKHFEDGRKAFEGGQFEPALREFTAAQELYSSPNTRLYIARCYRGTGRVASAYTTYRLASREAQDRLASSGEKRYAATRDAANAEATELEAKVPRVTLAVPSDVPSDFAIQVDGKDVPRAGWGTSVETDPGPHKVHATGHRLTDADQTFTLSEGEQKRVEVNPAHMPTATLKVAFKNRPAGLALEVDGAPLDPAAAEQPREVDPGNHKVAIHAPGYVDFTWTKALVDKEQAIVPVDLKPVPAVAGASAKGTPKWLFFVAAGATVIALGAGTFFAIKAKGDSDDAQKPPPPLRDPGPKDTIRSESTTANILFIGGAALAVGTGVLLFTTNWKSSGAPPSKVRVEGRAPVLAPWIGAGGGGLAATGAF